VKLCTRMSGQEKISCLC